MIDKQILVDWSFIVNDSMLSTHANQAMGVNETVLENKFTHSINCRNTKSVTKVRLKQRSWEPRQNQHPV